MYRAHLFVLITVSFNLIQCFDIEIEDIVRHNETEDDQFQALIEIVALKDTLSTTKKALSTPELNTTETFFEEVFEKSALLSRLLSFIQKIKTPVYTTNIYLNLFRNENVLAATETTEKTTETTKTTNKISTNLTTLPITTKIEM